MRCNLFLKLFLFFLPLLPDFFPIFLKLFQIVQLSQKLFIKFCDFRMESFVVALNCSKALLIELAFVRQGIDFFDLG